MPSTQLAFEFHPFTIRPAPPGIARDDKAKARDILVAIRTLKQVELEKRPATLEEGLAIQRFWGFGPVALSMFPDPVTGRYKDAAWKDIGSELKDLLTPEEYASAKRTTFNAFYTSPTVINAIIDAIARLGIPGKPCSYSLNANTPLPQAYQADVTSWPLITEGRDCSFDALLERHFRPANERLSAKGIADFLRWHKNVSHQHPRCGRLRY
jgi:hypothetical protein